MAMTTEERDAVRDLLVRYESALALAEDLASILLDVLQPGIVEISMEQARERRKFVADALASLKVGEEYAHGVWTDLALERRKAPASTKVLPAGGKDRRREHHRPRRATN